MESIDEAWTDEQLERMDYMLDTKRDTTLSGSPRCDYCYKGIDYYDDVEWMRCTEPATAKVRVTSRGKTFDAVSCEGCVARIQQRKDDELDDPWIQITVVKIGDLPRPILGKGPVYRPGLHLVLYARSLEFAASFP